MSAVTQYLQALDNVQTSLQSLINTEFNYLKPPLPQTEETAFLDKRKSVLKKIKTTLNLAIQTMTQIGRTYPLIANVPDKCFYELDFVVGHFKRLCELPPSCIELLNLISQEKGELAHTCKLLAIACNRVNKPPLPQSTSTTHQST